ncbi:unnamed protein product [Candidula unifasciata]|uniref:EF-hand domain-containing protein n=1 Tax=Candidula unifasciata TaxID=100452 RepID=A0A8S3YZV2_9EUPU|nr:unnamed protein product [Candidula unifasciata]
MAAALLSFLFKKKECETETVEPEFREDTRLLYFTAEFQSLGDMTKDNHLRLEEFTRLMLLLGYPSDEEEVEKIWTSIGLPDGGLMTLDDYLKLMSNEEIRSKTDTWRKLFAKFDTNGNGFASKSEVVTGLQEIGIDITPTLRAKIEGMDTNKDGNISYAEFLKIQLRQD